MGSVGERIKQIRISKGITQTELADSIGTTKGVISRYEQGKRKIRFAQAQGIADFLGVSVFELYGVSNEKQIWIENSQKLLMRIREQIQRNLEENPNDMMLQMDNILQAEADRIDKELQGEIDFITVVHNAQVDANLVDQPAEVEKPAEALQPDPAIKLQNKRTDNLVRMFSAYPKDIQNRILDVVATFCQLNSVGQKQALKRIKELAELPRYQIQKENDDET